MAILYDNASSGGYDASSANLSHTVSGENRLLVVAITQTNAPFDDVTSVAYNGTSMVHVVSSSSGGGTRTHLYYLVNPDTGTNNVSVSLDGTGNFGIMAVSYTGVLQVSPLITSANATDTSSPISTNISTDDINQLVVGAWCDDDDVADVRTPQTGVTERLDVLSGNADGGQWFGERIEPTAGSYAVGYTTSANPVAAGGVLAVFAPTILTSTTSSSSSTSTTSTSSSTSTTTTIDPNGGGLAHGEENPTQSELPISWQTLSDGAGGIPSTSGNPDWGIMVLGSLGTEGRSKVYDFGNSINRSFTLTTDRYESGSGSGTLYIRGHDSTIFAQDDETPAWEEYTAPIGKTWRYIQVRAVQT